MEALQRRNQRSVPQSAQKCAPEKHAALLNSVREENLEDQRFALHDQELECRRSAPCSAAASKNRIRSSALQPVVSASCGSRTSGAHKNVLRQDLAHFDNLLGNRSTSGSCSTICGAGSSRVGKGANKFLRSGHGKQPVWPRPAGLFFKAEELRLVCGGSLDRGGVVRLAPPHPGPGNRLSS